VLAWLAAQRAGVVGHQRALAAGLTAATLQRRLAVGALHRVHHGVYAVGHVALADAGWWHAALEACGEGAVLSHLSAARHWRLLPAAPVRPVHVTVSRQDGPRRRPGIVAHRPLAFPARDVVVRDRLPVTSVARTVLDIAPALDQRGLALVLHRARVEQRIGDGALRAAIERAPRARGRRGVERVAFGAAVAPNRRERRFLRLVRAAGLPAPQPNALVQTADGPYRVDCLWPERRLVYEIDDLASHATAKALVDDRRRDNALHDAGYRVRRLTDADLWGHPERTLARLAAQLGCDRRRGVESIAP
jgi:very-short-patch-repair endonuclease